MSHAKKHSIDQAIAERLNALLVKYEAHKDPKVAQIIQGLNSDENDVSEDDVFYLMEKVGISRESIRAAAHTGN